MYCIPLAIIVVKVLASASAVVVLLVLLLLYLCSELCRSLLRVLVRWHFVHYFVVVAVGILVASASFDLKEHVRDVPRISYTSSLCLFLLRFSLVFVCGCGPHNKEIYFCTLPLFYTARQLIAGVATAIKKQRARQQNT